jgi:hypothetical protein
MQIHRGQKEKTLHRRSQEETPEGEWEHSEHCRDHFVRTLATRKLTWRCSLGQGAYRWEFRIAEERQENWMENASSGDLWRKEGMEELVEISGPVEQKWNPESKYMTCLSQKAKQHIWILKHLLSSKIPIKAIGVTNMQKSELPNSTLKSNQACNLPKCWIRTLSFHEHE